VSCVIVVDEYEYPKNKEKNVISILKKKYNNKKKYLNTLC